MFLLVAVIGAVAQFVDGAMGMGYGTTAASVLIAAGLFPALVSASVHTAETFTTLASGVSHLKLGNVDRGIVLPLAVSGIIGGVAGAYLLASLVSGKDMRPLVAVILLLLGLSLLLRAWRGRMANSFGGRTALSRKLLWPLGLAAGAVDAIGGGGWGPVATATLMTGRQTEPRLIVGSVNLAEFFVTLAITLTFGLTLGFENFLWHITIPLIIGGVLVAPVAALVSRRVSPKLLMVSVGVLLVLLNGKTAFQSLAPVVGFSLPAYFDVLFITLVGVLAAALVIGWLYRSRRTSPRSLEVGAGGD
jgi:uncharacterized membrane protein YfcA